MPFKISILGEPNIIELRYEGTVNNQERCQARSEVHSILDLKGLMHLLVDMRDVKFDMSTVEIYDFPSKIKRPPGMRIALVGDAEDDNIRFFRNAAVNRGIPMELFAEYPHAMAYLTE